MILPATDDFVFEIEPGRLPHGLYDLKNACASAFPEIVGFVTSAFAVVEDRRVRRQCFQGEEVAGGEVKHVKIIPHASPIAEPKSIAIPM